MCCTYLSHRLCLLYILLILINTGCTDHFKEVDIDLPAYKPQLVVIAAAGPITGAEAFVTWSIPYSTQTGSVPELPPLSLYLLENGQRVAQFEPQEQGNYSIAPENLSLKEHTPYALELRWPTGESRLSENCTLPPKPIVKLASAQSLASYRERYDILLLQGPSSARVHAYSILPVLLTEDKQPLTSPDLYSYFKSPELHFTDSPTLPQQTLHRHYDRLFITEAGDSLISQSVDIRIAYLSTELARLKKEVDEIASYREASYQNPRNIHTNIKGIIGVFGLYNELSTVVPVVVNSQNLN